MPKALRVLPSLALALLLTAAVAVLRAAPALATSNQETVFQDDTQLHGNLGGTLSTLSALGVERVRVFMTWSSIAPNPNSSHKPLGFNAADPGAYPSANWAFYDALVQQAKADHIKLDFTLSGPAPAWAAGKGWSRALRGPENVWKPSAAEFGKFVQAVGTRYDGRHGHPKVDYWAIWNEPNYGPNLAPQEVHRTGVEVAPLVYRGLVDAAWSSLHRTGHSHDTILIGEIAPRGQISGGQPGNYSGMVPLRFLHALYCVDTSNRPLRGRAASARGCPTSASATRRFRSQHPALFSATGFADHPYPQGQNPTRQTWPFGGVNQYTDLPQLGALERFLDTANHVYGSHTRFRIYSTEYGLRTNPPTRGQPSYATSALYLNWAEYLSYRSSRLVTYMQYGLVDPPGGNFPSGLEDKNGRPKATFDAFRLPLFLPVTSTRHGRSLEVWGAVRPAHNFSGLRHGLIQFQRGSHGSFTTLASVPIRNSRGYFDVRIKFPASGSVRLAWTDAGTALSSRTQKISIH